MVVENKEHIEIREFGEECFVESAQLSMFAFQTSRTEEELALMRSKFEQESITRLGAFVNGELAAQTSVLHVESYINGSSMGMGGIAAVATWPQYRRQGLVGKLLERGLILMKDRGELVSFLSPFSASFYRKFGWEMFAEQRVYTLDRETMPKRVPYSGTMKRSNYQDPVVRQLYAQFAERYTGMMVRTNEWWEDRVNRFKPGQYNVYIDENNKPAGYLLYEVKNKQLTVHELVYTTEEAYLALLSFMAQHDSMIDKIKLKAPFDDMLPYILHYSYVNIELQPYFMARIVDAVPFVAQFKFKPAHKVEGIKLHLADRHAPWNDGTFLLTVDEFGEGKLVPLVDEKVDVKQSEISFNSEQNEIFLSIEVLTAIMLGSRNALDLLRFDFLQGDVAAIEQLSQLIPGQQLYLMDMF